MAMAWIAGRSHPPPAGDRQRRARELRRPRKAAGDRRLLRPDADFVPDYRQLLTLLLMTTKMMPRQLLKMLFYVTHPGPAILVLCNTTLTAYGTGLIKLYCDIYHPCSIHVMIVLTLNEPIFIFRLQ